MVWKLDENLRRRLEEEIGQPYTDVRHGFKVGEIHDIWFIVPPKHLDKIEVNQIVLIYDIARKAWFGGKIKSIEIRRPSEFNREKRVYDIDMTPIVEQIEKGLTSEFMDPLLVKVELFCMFEEGIKKPVFACPSNASVLLLPHSIPEVPEEPSLIKILGLPEKGIPLGIYSQAQKPYLDTSGEILVYRLNIGNIQNKHILILGSTGQGKTVFIKHLIKQLNNAGYGILVFDIQGDIVQLPFEPSNEQMEKLTELDSRFHQLIGEDNLDPQKVRVLFPLVRNMNEHSKEKKKLLKEFAEYQGIEFKEFGIRFSNIKHYEQLAPYMPNLTENALDVLARTIEEYGGVSLEEFIEDMTHDVQQYSRYDIVLKRIPDYPINSSTFSNLIRNLQALKNRGVFDAGKELPIKDFVEPGNVVIIYMEHLTEHQKQIFEHYIMYNIYRNKTKVENPGVFIVIDEAHSVIPKKSPPGSYKHYADEVARIFSKIAREGRKYGINLLVSTHMPRDIHPVVYDLCGTKISFRISIDDAKELGMPPEIASQIAQYNKGFALVNSPENSDISGIVPWLEIKTVMPKALHMEPKKFFDMIKEELPKIRDQRVPEEVRKIREKRS